MKQKIRAFWSENPCDGAPHQLVSPQLEGTQPFSLEFYDRIAGIRYDEHPHLHDAFEFDKHTGHFILEIGCGLGTDLRQFVQNGAIAVGFDLGYMNVLRARQNFRLHGLYAEFVNGDAEILPFPNDSFDFVFSNGVLHHTPDTERAVSEIHRVLRVGGKAVVMLYHRWSISYIWGVLFLAGVVKGGLLRHHLSLRRLLSSSTDGAGNPLSKIYSRRQARNLFSTFRNVHVATYHIPHTVLFPVIGKYFARQQLPQFAQDILDRIGRIAGWHLIIHAIK